ncbi:MAG: DUF4926 domain-containing protein [Anaerolineaceae bacterium]|nr:MAG: DUF4926 domain-containing protein [Anaerolineaceae bacterium]
MQPELYTRVVLVQDIPQANLKAGDTAMYIDYLPVKTGEAGAILEVFNALGESIDVVTVPISAIAPLTADQIPAVRTRAG